MGVCVCVCVCVQVASGALGMTGLLAPQTPHSSWVDIQNAAANFYQYQAAGLVGAHASLLSISSLDPSLSTNKVWGYPPHRTLVQIFPQL